jgi:hypothetical protein
MIASFLRGWLPRFVWDSAGKIKSPESRYGTQGELSKIRKSVVPPEFSLHCTLHS